MKDIKVYEEPVAAARKPSTWKPSKWTKKTWMLLAGGTVVVLAIVIPVAVVVSRNKSGSAYPAYAPLNYTLVDTYASTDFFDNFNYFTGYDPAQGFVHYVPSGTAAALNLTTATVDSAVVRVDTSVGPSSSPDASTGRFSVRIESKKQYDGGLFVFEVKHTPYGCGTWPALWLVDPNSAIWPAHGEIDIMEAANEATSGNMLTLHSSADCTMSGVKRSMTGTATQGDCHNVTNGNAGCGVDGSVATYGAAYNELAVANTSTSSSSAVVAVEWRSDGIRMWQFDAAGVPADIVRGAPDPSTWGTALADFPSTKCDMGAHFKNASIVANIDLCGALGEIDYQASSCPKPCVGDYPCIGGMAPTNCTDYVANNPAAFENAYWEFGSFTVYQAS